MRVVVVTLQTEEIGFCRMISWPGMILHALVYCAIATDLGLASLRRKFSLPRLTVLFRCLDAHPIFNMTASSLR